MPPNTLTKEKQETPFWSLSDNEAVAALGTDAAAGLSEAEAAERLKQFGENVIERRAVTPWVRTLLAQFKSPLILFLTAAGVVTIFIDHARDAIFIFAAVVANAALGFYQENKAEQALAELKTYLRQRARVIRDGVDHEIDAAYLVPGDIIRLAQGDRVPADARLLYANDVRVDEAILTGESLPVHKSVDPVDSDAVPGDRTSMLMAGTLVTQGVATAVVSTTGLATELGKIAEMIGESDREETPLQKSIRRFSVHAGLVLGALTLAVFVIGVVMGRSYLEMFLLSVAIGVSAVPEGLPVAMTVILAVGVQRMARRKGVVRKLVAAETLGGATVIITDKTGTLTVGSMALGSVIPLNDMSENELLAAALLNADVSIENPNDPPAEWRMDGRTLETSLMRSSALRGIDVQAVKNDTPVAMFLPFNPVNKFSATLIEDSGGHSLVLLGAPDVLIARSALSAREQDDMFTRVEQLAGAGELVVGVARKRVKVRETLDLSDDRTFTDLAIEGLITLRDPVRPQAKGAIESVRSSGIRVVIMSGDHRGTVEAVAREVGVPVGVDGVLDAVDLRALSDAELRARLPQLSVISRVSPADKQRVVVAFQELGEVVAMTGDGVNDAPSVRRADIGIAMGSGTEVTRDVADLVLLDDNFETIAAAVEEGRRIMANIRTVLVYLLSTVLNELVLIGGALATGIALPLSAAQILWVNFFSDSFPAVAFAFESGNRTLGAGRLPNTRKLFSPIMRSLIIFIGLATSVLLFGLYWFLLRAGFSDDLVRTFIFASFGTSSLFLAFSVRSLRESIFAYPLFSNKYLVSGVGVGIVLMGIAIYAPFLQGVFGTVPLPLSWLAGVIGIGLINIAFVEVGKWVFRGKDISQRVVSVR